jgi:hypothetical protein
VDGAELHQVKIVGDVTKVKEQSTFTKFDVDRGNEINTPRRSNALLTCRLAVF